MYALAVKAALATALLLGKGLAFSPIPPSYSRLPTNPLMDPRVVGATRSASVLGNQETEPLKIFDESIYSDIASAYEKLDKRFKEGPGCLTASELHHLEAELTRIAEEMKQNQHKRPGRPSMQTSDSNSNDSSEAAPEHERKGGFDGRYGVPQGTTNTYVIDGMDEMTPEEYQVAIQEAVSARQRQRRQSGTVGNQTSQNYLDRLGK